MITPKPGHWTIWTENGQKDLYFGSETRYETRIKYGVYSCPSLHILRIENKAKTKKNVFYSGKMDFGEKSLKTLKRMIA